MNKKRIAIAFMISAIALIFAVTLNITLAQGNEPIFPSIQPYTAQLDDIPKNIAEKWDVPEEAIFSSNGSPLAPGSGLHSGLDLGKRLSVVIRICACYPDGKGGEWCWEQNANEWGFVWGGREVDSCL